MLLKESKYIEKDKKKLDILAMTRKFLLMILTKDRLRLNIMLNLF